MPTECFEVPGDLGNTINNIGNISPDFRDTVQYSTVQYSTGSVLHCVLSTAQSVQQCGGSSAETMVLVLFLDNELTLAQSSKVCHFFVTIFSLTLHSHSLHKLLKLPPPILNPR